MNVERVEGIGPKYAKTLAKAKVRNTATLLKKGATPEGRKALAKATGLSPKLILEWVNLSDLLRVKGVGEEYSDLLEEAGVDTVKELRNRTPAALHKAMLQTNMKKKLVRRAPNLPEVERWVKEAKKLPPVVKY